MYKEVLENFNQLVKIPHCSGDTAKMKDYITSYAKECGYAVKSDKAGNILAFKNTPVLALQSHYDMVCVGNAPDIEIVEQNGWLKAKNSSLGADNGIGVAIMLALMKKYDNLEFLFTNDEEIGLIGAFNLELDIKSKYLLNLDSEDEHIYIGCAGGVDAVIEYPVEYTKVKGCVGEIVIDKLPGGHSGVDIDKKIPNAIVELIKKIDSLVTVKGGERRNSIPVKAVAKVLFEGNEEVDVIKKDFLEFLKKLPHGVLEWDFEYKVVSKSLNFALIDNNKIIYSLRANTNEKLSEVKSYLKEKCAGIDVKFEGEYPAWDPEVSRLAEILKDLTSKEYKVIHAGLECAVLKDKLPNVSMASYGPVIENPHSVNERVNIESVKRVCQVIEKLVMLLNET